ncbi:MAG: ABC transporter ATP-binding protein [Dongiaceae bacterium]
MTLLSADFGSSAVVEQPLLRIDNVTLQYSDDQKLITATRDVSFDVYRGDRFVLLGPSGCGKSTLLKAVGGFLAPRSGQILLDGKKVTRPGPDRMMVFQDFEQLLPWKTVLGNVVFPLLKSGKFRRREARERAGAVIEQVGLGKFRDSYPHTLSGGMKQRVAIARALALEPAILLMDEPFAALDSLTRRRMQEDLLSLWDDRQFTLLFVTHAIDEAIVLGTRILVLSPHPGQVRAELSATGLGHDQRSSPDFVALETHLQKMLTEPNAAFQERAGHGAYVSRSA